MSAMNAMLAPDARCGSISPESKAPCVLSYDDPHVGGHVALLKPFLSAGWWYGDERDACERALHQETA